MEDKKFNYNALLSSARLGKSSRSGTRNIEAFSSDRSRILYSSAFRRLQQKAQVFSMETNSNVRSRLTHSLEVADLGRRLAESIGAQLKNRKDVKGFTDITGPVVVSIVENACLLHDIGNPPFGHFGEAAIQDWAKKQVRHLAPKGMVRWDENGEPVWEAPLDVLMQDFEEFDGNPQGFRTVTKLFKDFGDCGLNLTCATLLCALKYARAAGEQIDHDLEPEVPRDIVKKAGYFHTEDAVVEQLRDTVGLPAHRRYPLTYIMEAADDIAYCMSDIADGIEKKLLSERKFIETFADIWDEKYGGDYPEEIERLLPEYRQKKRRKNQEPQEMNGFNRDFSVPWSIRATRDAVGTYIDEHDQVFAGTAAPLMERDSEMCRVLKTIRAVCGRALYPSTAAESIELTGYAVISGILRHYERILELDYQAFEWLTDPAAAEKKKNPKVKLDVERRLFHRFSSSCLAAYRNAVEALDPQAPDFAALEWWLRVHLVIDHISCMTDAHALETYQMLEGIALMRT